MISIITPVEMSLDIALSASLGTISMLLLLALLVLKEVAMNLEGAWQTLGRFLNIALVPLLITFSVIALIGVIDVLQQFGGLR